MQMTADERRDVMEKYRRWVIHLAKRRTRSPLDEDDLVQEGMIGLANSIEGFDPEKASLMTYSKYHIEYAMQRAERRPHRRTHVTSWDGVERALAPSLGFDPLEIAELVERLPERERKVVRRYFWKGETLKQIGSTMGLSHEMVRLIKLSALDRLRNRLG